MDTHKKRTIIAIVIAFVLVVIGLASWMVSNKIDLSLPEDAKPIPDSYFEAPDNEDEGFLAIEYNGKTYIPYGTIGTKIVNKDIGECVGYMPSDKETRYFSLTADSKQDFIMQIDVDGVLEKPTFYRAIDTRGKDIEIPDYIDSYGYEYWN